MIHLKSEVDPNAIIGENVTVCAFATIRADEGPVSIGKNCNVQECCIIHGDAVEIGENVTIGHGAIVHGAKIGNNVLIGMNATILDGAEVGDWCIIGAGALVTPSMKIESGSVVVGLPAKFLRCVTETDKETITLSWKNYANKAN